MTLKNGKNLVAQSQSGTGKTATFLIGSLNRIDITQKKTQILILSPNRELAQQIFNVMKGLSSYMKITSLLTIGGTNI